MVNPPAPTMTTRPAFPGPLSPPPQLPPGVRAFAIVFVWIAGSLILGTINSLPDWSNLGVLVIPFLFQVVTLFYLFGYLAIGYLKGLSWAWWFSYINSILALFLLPIYTLSLFLSQAPISLLLVMLSYWLIALLTYLSLRTPLVRIHFHILDVNLTRCCVVLVLLASLQTAWWFAPVLLINMYLKLNSFS